MRPSGVGPLNLSSWPGTFPGGHQRLPFEQRPNLGEQVFLEMCGDIAWRFYSSAFNRAHEHNFSQPSVAPFADRCKTLGTAMLEQAAHIQFGEADTQFADTVLSEVFGWLTALSEKATAVERIGYQQDADDIRGVMQELQRYFGIEKGQRLAPADTARYHATILKTIKTQLSFDGQMFIIWPFVLDGFGTVVEGT